MMRCADVLRQTTRTTCCANRRNVQARGTRRSGIEERGAAPASSSRGEKLPMSLRRLRNSFLAAATCAAILAPGPVAAEESLRDLIVRARAVFDGAQYEEALDLFEKILARDDHPVPRLYKARCLVALERELDTAARLLDSVAGSTKLGPLADEVPVLRERIAWLQRPARLTVTVEGAGATGARALVDGRDMGPAPYVADVSRGIHTVQVSGPGCDERTERFQAAPEDVIALRFRCEELSARVSITTQPAGATVYVDDQPLGTTPFPAPLMLSPGAHTVRAERKGHVAARRALDVAPGDTEDLLLVLSAEGEGGGSSAWAWTTLGTGVALVGAGVGFFAHYGIQYGKATLDPPPGRAADTVGTEDLIAGGVLAGVGAGLVVTSFFLWPDQESADAARAVPSLSPTPGGAVLGWSGRF